MYHILFSLRNDMTNVLSEELLDRHCDGVHHVLLEVILDQVFLEPVVTDELSLAVADLDTGEAVGLSTVKLLDVRFVIVADVFAKRGLLMEPRSLPLRAVCVAYVIWAFVPGLKNRHYLRCILDDHEASVGVCAVKAVRVVLRRLWVPWVLGHCDSVTLFNIPVIQHPLDGYVEEAESSVGIEKYDELVVLDVICQCRRLDPRRVSVFKIGGVDELVVVAVDERVCVVVKDSTRDVIDITPLILAPLESVGALQWACLEIQNEDFAAERFLVAGKQW